MSLDPVTQWSAIGRVLAAHPNAGGGDQVFAVVDTLAASPDLRRVAFDVELDGSERGALLRSVLAGRVAPDVLDVVVDVAALDWADASELGEALSLAGIGLTLRSADEQGVLDEVLAQLFGFGDLVTDNDELRTAMAGEPPFSDLDARYALVDSLLGGRAPAQAVLLAKRAIVGTHRTYAPNVHAIGQVAALLRGHALAEVRVARPLSPEQQARLRAQLSRIYGVEVDLEIDVDPSLIGGVRVNILDELIDGSIAARLADARRVMAG